MVAAPQQGTLTFDADGGFVYVPWPGFTGTDTFQYKANDGMADSNVATVTINVIPLQPRAVGTSAHVSIAAAAPYALNTGRLRLQRS